MQFIYYKPGIELAKNKLSETLEDKAQYDLPETENWNKLVLISLAKTVSI